MNSLLYDILAFPLHRIALTTFSDDTEPGENYVESINSIDDSSAMAVTPDRLHPDSPTVPHPTRPISKSANNSEGAPTPTHDSQGLSESSQDGQRLIRRNSASPVLLPTARAHQASEAGKHHDHGADQPGQQNMPPPSILQAPMSVLPEVEQSLPPIAMMQPAPQHHDGHGQHEVQQSLQPTDMMQLAPQHHDGHGQQEVQQSHQHEVAQVARTTSDGRHPSNNISAKGHLLGNLQGTSDNKPAAHNQSGWEKNGRVDPIHGQTYRHTSNSRGNTNDNALVQRRDARSYTKQSTKSSIPEGCLNARRSGRDVTYEDCRCRRCEGKHRAIFVCGLVLRPTQSRIEITQVLKDFFSAHFGMVEDVTINEKPNKCPTAFIK